MVVHRGHWRRRRWLGFEVQVPDEGVLCQRDLALLVEIRVLGCVGHFVEGDHSLHLGQNCVNGVLGTALVEAVTQCLDEPRAGTAPEKRKKCTSCSNIQSAKWISRRNPKGTG